jgi:hypothetical protein
MRRVGRTSAVCPFDDYQKEVTMKLSKKVAVVAAAAVASAGLAAGLAGSASASSRVPAPAFGGSFNCAHGIYAGYCGTAESATHLYLASDQHGQIIGVRHPQAWNAEFFWLADGTSTSPTPPKYVEWAPGGVASNKVMAEVHHRVVLVNASGATDQKWSFNGTGWTNVATGDVLRTTASNGPVLAVNGPPSGPSETFHFVAP